MQDTNKSDKSGKFFHEFFFWRAFISKSWSGQYNHPNITGDVEFTNGKTVLNYKFSFSYIFLCF